MMLQALQELLSSIYDVPQTHLVSEFLLTDRRRLPDGVDAGRAEEQVLVSEQGDTLWISLFLEGGLLDRLSSADPLESLHGGNIADYWIALEGVSHFVCVAWHAENERPVTLLELELQGEIDKYVCTYWLLTRQNPGRFPVELHHLLFERSRIDATLAGERFDLYRKANEYAARYCRRLSRCLRSRERDPLDAAVAELRHFYRLNRERKLRFIERL